ncbi:MAG TPA: TonB family protein [Candidatus Aquilonibacter sp.]|nr:TonB family protein [Candidatus Aquilonibacter sp.]
MGAHLLLLVILVVGPAFFNPTPKTDNTQVLDMIPANLIDAAFNSGVKSAQPPPPAPQPIVQPQPQPQPAPPTPKPVEPTPTLVKRIENYFTPEPKPEPEKQASKPVENPPHQIKPNLNEVVRTPSRISAQTDNSKNSRVLNNVLRSLQHNLSSDMKIDMPGNSSVAYANYGDVVVSVYHNAWISPDNMAGNSAVVKFSVTIARDGRVINAHIIESSGDANVDAAVQRMLDRVVSIAPFPDGATENERTYTINFNAIRTIE